MKTTLVLCLVALLAMTAPATAEPSGDDGSDAPQSCITFMPGQTPPVIIQPSACLPADGDIWP